MQHLDEGTIHSWLDGALSADEAARAEAHVAECAQCAAAVAEARGFIAASSRILTALDVVPRGVIPIAPRATTRNWPAWRAAAAVVVVALGSLVVLKERGPRESARDSAASSSSVRAPLAATRPTADSPVGVTGGGTAAATQQTVPASAPRTLSRNIPAQPQASNRGSVSNQVITDNTASPLRGTVSGFETRRAAAPPRAQTPPPTAAVTTGSARVMEAANESIPLKEVKRERVIGGTQITYAFEQRDTVTLLEQDSDVRLMSAAVSGAVAGVTATSKTAGRASAEAGARDADRAEKPQTASASAAQKAAALPAAVPSPEASANQVNTISWRDASTGKMLTLSGRVAKTQLEEIKHRIERERATSKNKP